MARQAGETVTRGSAGHFLVAKLALGALWLLARLPLGPRLAVAGWLGGRIVGPLTGTRARAARQLAEICPELPPNSRRRHARDACANALRGIVETHAGAALIGHVADHPLTGRGLDLLRELKGEGRGALILTGHFGSTHSARAALTGWGTPVPTLYRETSNPWLNAAYQRVLGEVARPVFPRGRKGLAEMVRHLRGGGVVAILADQVPEQQGVWLSFFGRPALTSLAPAELALKYDVPLITGFGTRLPDGRVAVEIEAAIPPGTPEAMMQAFNDRLEARIRGAMGQWLWMCPRWRNQPGAPERPAGQPRSA
jgi:Kdo2-lipid IVA lauroyltransferase/acyltransferase